MYRDQLTASSAHDPKVADISVFSMYSTILEALPEAVLMVNRLGLVEMVPDEEGNLLLDIELPDGIRTSYDKKIEFHQEMNGTADIVTEDLRLLERLLYQFRGIFNR